MLRSLNSGVSGLRAFQTKLDVIGNNIANVNTTGFKKSRVVFEDLFSQTIKNATAATEISGGVNPLQIGIGTNVASVDQLFSPGSPTTTNNVNDLYLDGDGFFVVQNGSGTQYLTRAGNFSLDSLNHLVNPDGMLVMDTSDPQEPIIIPADAVTYSIDSNGIITGVNALGERILGVDANGNSVTDPNAQYNPIKIAIATVDNPNGLKKLGGSLYTTTTNSGDVEIPNRNGITNTQIITGALEMSNVDLAEEMTDMITAQRGFQANSKIITTSDMILDELINLKR
ncbi:flagellar hook-basal body complex protein [Neobacillus niacini]|uniref:flagellar hook-basal body complex protein n=1 Tax=Neobacillus niacini TaxID=86668 RepID=UPI0020406301|nr:flagellar hook-basal body complex protein [Neobacillus niacini]MCM3693270.1 flagellar hook-basal body complex protein [Neobacillus niacini]